MLKPGPLDSQTNALTIEPPHHPLAQLHGYTFLRYLVMFFLFLFTLLDKEDANKMATDAMFKLEHGVQDVQKSKAVLPTLHQLKVLLFLFLLWVFKVQNGILHKAHRPVIRKSSVRGMFMYPPPRQD